MALYRTPNQSKLFGRGSRPMSIQLRPFQREFLRGALDPAVDCAALSTPRGNGKSTLAAHLVSRIMDPDDELFRSGTESVLLAASIKQARIVYRMARDLLAVKGKYKFLDATNRVGITHPETLTRLDVISSSGKSAMGLVNCPWAIADEPGAFEVNAGGLMWDALTTAQGKPGSPLKILLIGTLAPGGVEGSWWGDLVKRGSHGSTFVQALQGDPERWDNYHEIRRVNPLMAVSASFRKKLLSERDEARRDSRLKARFLSYRLNVPSGDESSMLLSVDDWQRTLARPVPDRDGCLPIVGVDLGAGRAFSAATAVWPSGRVESIAVCPGIPSIEDQERRDRVPRGTYRMLVERGVLRISEGLRVQPVGDLWNSAVELWGGASVVLCDRFRAAELMDATMGTCPIVARTTQWSQSSEDIRALRKLCKDGPMSVHGDARLLLSASMATAMVQTDSAGNSRLVKKEKDNSSRDDAAQALLLAAGQWARVRAAEGRGSGFYSIRVG